MLGILRADRKDGFVRQGRVRDVSRERLHRLVL